MLPNLETLLHKWKCFTEILGAYSQNEKYALLKLKNLLLFKKSSFLFREHAPEMEILYSRIQNISPVLKTLVFNLGSMLPI